MFGFKSTREQLLDERRRNARLQAAVAKTSADVGYIAMMTDVDIDTGAEPETQMEVTDNE